MDESFPHLLNRNKTKPFLAKLQVKICYSRFYTHSYPNQKKFGGSVVPDFVFWYFLILWGLFHPY